MARLEDLKPNCIVRGLVPSEKVTVKSATWFGTSVVEIVYKDSQGRLGQEMVYRDREGSLEIELPGIAWSFDGDGQFFKYASEAYRIRLAYLFDPLLAIHTSVVDPLPHQITAVYGELIQRQPLRFLLADDPGAGKTIMAGLLIKELIARGDLQKCLIVCPGNLVEQWQDELNQKFHLTFDIMTNDKLESSPTGNWFLESPFAIVRLDKTARDENVQQKLEQTDWDLIICDEAHKMSASFYGGEVKYTKRYHVGQLVSRLTRHFLLMTATPHNGKEEDFQLFMALLDGDRFEGRFRDGVHLTDTSDMMRRAVKEQMFKFDGTPLFPERFAYTVNYKLSDPEAQLYQKVTAYVREEFNRAESLESEGRKGTVGFALTVLQRRLASSPEAIYQSLRRRRERLENRLREEMLLKRGAESSAQLATKDPMLSEDDIDNIDDVTSGELEETEESVVDKATAARTIAELRAEIEILKGLEALALEVKQLKSDKKWEELSNLLLNNSEMFDAEKKRHKLVIFTEHKDTLNYLVERIRTLLGVNEAVVQIHGSMGREDRNNSKERFLQDKEVRILVATDAAGEGINLQRAHLMVNYDLPWNPNRIEQRFGRIHRIGQTEVCHLWNLVASETREGEVFTTLCKKLEEESKALNGKIFDVLGKAFSETPLRQLLIEAIRYGDRPEVRAKLTKVIESALDKKHLEDLVEERALSHDSMDSSRLMKIRETMDRAEARRLQPHFIASFFMECFKLLSGTIREREPKRYEITYVPAIIRQTDRQIGTRDAVLERYERITFEKDLISVPDKPLAEFIAPGHPLLDATIHIVRERYRSLLKQGTIFVDANTGSTDIRLLFFLEFNIQDGRVDKHGNRRTVSQQLHFLELTPDGQFRLAGYAPYLDYEPLKDSDRQYLGEIINDDWLKAEWETKAIGYAAENIIPRHFDEIRSGRIELTVKTMAAVKDRLTKEINYWDLRANELKTLELAGKVNAKINSGMARKRADDLQERLRKRLEELELEKHLSPSPPVIIGGALVIPALLLKKLKHEPFTEEEQDAEARAEVERKAMQAVIDVERELGYEPVDVSKQKCGYDIESHIVKTGRLRFIEVKGRRSDALTVTVTKNEILTGLNKPDSFILAVVKVDQEETKPYYIRSPFTKEPDFAATSVNYNLPELLSKAEEPP